MKKLLILLPLSMVLMVTSCSNIRSFQLTGLMNEERKKIMPMSKEIIRCFTEKDKEALKKLFCEQIRNEPDFDNQLDRAFEFFPCENYIDSEIGDSTGGGESWDDGKRTEWDVSPDIPYIHILVNKDGDTESSYYSMYYHWTIVNDEDKSLVGLHYLEIELLNIDSILLGKKIE